MLERPLGIHVLSYGHDECTPIVDECADAPMSGSNTHTPELGSPANMADAKSALAFGRAAVSFEVHESDFLVMAADKISTFEAMAYRFPASADLEDYLKKVLRKRAAYRDDNGEIVIYDDPLLGRLQVRAGHGLPEEALGTVHPGGQAPSGEAGRRRRRGKDEDHPGPCSGARGQSS